MSQFKFNFTLPDKNKAFLVQRFHNYDTTCLIDTGANVPIWFGDIDSFLRRFPDAFKTSYKTIISGLGQTPHINVPVYCIPEFRLIDDYNNCITFVNLLIPVLNSSKYSYHMIISLTMLNRYDFSFSYENSVLNGYFTLFTPKDTYFVRPILTSGILDKIQVFTQET